MGSSHVAGLQKLQDALAGRRDVRVALMFGSRARGTHRASSDLDLAVEAPGVDLLALAADLTLALSVPVDVVSIEPSEASIPLLEEVLRDGVVVHQGTPGAAASWRSRVLSCLETDRPWHAAMRDAYLKRVAAKGFDHGQP